jgi:hypothetical protein
MLNVGGKLFRTMRQTLTILVLTMLLGCSKVDNESNTEVAHNSTMEKVYTAATLDEYQAMYSVQSYITTQEDESKTEMIDFDCAILIYPTDRQVEEMKKAMGEEDFYIVADDNNCYQATVIDLIDSLNIMKVTANGTYLRLKGISESWTLDIRKDNLPTWNLILFKRSKEPEIAPTVGCTIEYVRDYFEIAE